MSSLAIVPVKEHSTDLAIPDQATLPVGRISRSDSYSKLGEMRVALLKDAELARTGPYKQQADESPYHDVAGAMYVALGEACIRLGDGEKAKEMMMLAGGRIFAATEELSRTVQAVNAASDLGRAICEAPKDIRTAIMGDKSPFALMNEVVQGLKTSAELMSNSRENNPGCAFPRVTAGCYEAMSAASLFKCGREDLAIAQLQNVATTIATVNPNQSPDKEMDDRMIPIGPMVADHFIRMLGHDDKHISPEHKGTVAKFLEKSVEGFTPTTNEARGCLDGINALIRKLHS